MSPDANVPFRRWWLPALLLIALAGVCSGCKTTEDDMVERPWNAPKSWETGLPAGMMEGR
ncbi:MAG: hypothetical protein J0L84_04260 [Verrucomicrobia bacterium]|nr:hypothetical protein [Verrucomicrobiota bacterium]